MNAIVHALSDYCVTNIEMPATPERVLRALEERSQREPRRAGKRVIYDEEMSVSTVSDP